MTQTKAICVYAASSDDIDPKYKEAARRVGMLIARAGRRLVCGAGRTGLMGASIDGAIDAGGTVVGVIPQFMDARGWTNNRLTEKIVTPDMHTRKSAMMNMSSAAIALPGGVGTLEELLEAITWRQLGLFHGNIVILNQDGYYDPLLAMLQATVDGGFMRDDHTDLWQVAVTPDEAVTMALADDVHPGVFSQKIN